MNQISINEYLGLYLDKKYKQTTNLANFAAIIKEMVPQLNWVGFYLFDENELYLGPFQGKAAVQTIMMGDGVCGTSANKKVTIIVKDVHAYPGHIACDDASNSEIVIPIIKNNELLGVLDIDSPVINRFDKNTAETLQKSVDFLFDFL
ncbi:MAG: GAF domain-containing protein [Tenericutes bacterium]|jgi:L-methionine (R)-S-oxide reductase|nr:GAF domain-containing protein [Mycoplasmatota bacterium]